MDKKEQQEKRGNLIILGLGLLLAATLIILSRGGFSWFGQVSWSGIGWLEWLSIALLLIVAVLVQYYLLLLLRYSKLKYVVLVGIPVIWLFNNGLIAMSRFLDWTTDIGVAVGWLSLSDLISWLVGAVYFPILVSFGAVSAIIDANAAMLNQSCYYAKLALEITNVSPWQVIDFSMNIISILWDLLGSSFMQEVIKQTSETASLFEFSMDSAFSVPQWLTTVGYSISCLCL